jgi:uncharacterized protein YraI
MRKNLYIATLVSVAPTYNHLRSKVLVCVFILTLSSLACGVQTKLPVVVSNTQTTEASTAVNSTPTRESSRVIGSWNVRKAPGESSKLVATLTDVPVQVIRCKTYEGGRWCFIHFAGGKGWVNSKGLK